MRQLYTFGIPAPPWSSPPPGTLTSDYVFRAAFGWDRDDSRAALMAILNIILDRKGALNWLMRIEKVKIK